MNLLSFIKILSGRRINSVERGVLSPPEERDLCIWFNECSYAKSIKQGLKERILEKSLRLGNHYEKYCLTKLSESCKLYHLIQETQLELIWKKMIEMHPKEGCAFLRGLDPRIRREYYQYSLERATEAFRKDDERCLREYGESAWEHYDVEHPC